MKRIALMLALAGGLAASSAHAGSCDAPKTGFDRVYCFAKIYMELDGQLTTNYRTLMKSIPPRDQAILRDGQRAWIEQRDQQCYGVRNLSGDRQAHSVNIDCALDVTRNRVQFLSDRMAECHARGCNQGALARSEAHQ